MFRENLVGGFFKIQLKNACIQNLFNSRLNHINDKSVFYNLDTLMDENELSPYISKIKIFLKIIVDTNVYKQAIKKLFPEYYNYLMLNNNEEIKQYIDERIKFYPFENLDLPRLTDILSCYTFIPSIDFIIKGKKEYIISGESKDSYKVGLTIANLIHELNYVNELILFFKGKNLDIVNPIERIIEKNILISEEGNSLERLLFGKIINRINLFECLYIMNEKNYEQDLIQFRENFIKIKDIMKDTKGDSEFIKNKNGIFNNFYDNSIKVIKMIIENLNEKNNDFKMPKIYIQNYNKPEDEEDYIPQRKCALFGGG